MENDKKNIIIINNINPNDNRISNHIISTDRFKTKTLENEVSKPWENERQVTITSNVDLKCRHPEATPQRIMSRL